MEKFIGFRIRKIRELKGINQKYVADKLSISQGSYSDIETGKIPITHKRLSEIAEVLDVEEDTILEFDPKVVFEKCSQSGYINTNNLIDKEFFEGLVGSIKDVYEQRISDLKAIIEVLQSELKAK